MGILSYTKVNKPTGATYTSVSKPTGSSYTNIAKPAGVSGGGTIEVGMATGLLMSLTYATQNVISAVSDGYTKISKPT